MKAVVAAFSKYYKTPSPSLTCLLCALARNPCAPVAGAEPRIGKTVLEIECDRDPATRTSPHQKLVQELTFVVHCSQQ